MDVRLFDHIQKSCPQFNRDITRGLAVKAMAEAEQWIDRIWRCAEADFPPGLRYVDYQRCTPTEEYNIMTAKRSNSNNKLYYEYARTDVYLTKYIFEFEGERLPPRPLFLPYVEDGGIIHINGSVFSISPVLADRAISVGEDSIYVPVTRAKLTLRREIQPFIMDGSRVSSNVIWGNIHNGAVAGKAGTQRMVNANATLPHYLFCKYGLKEAFRRMAMCDVVVGYPATVNTDLYPQTEWHICESLRMKPIGVRGRFYTPTDIRIAIRKADYNVSTQGLIGGFFYVADRFPERMNPEWLDDTVHWRTLMGHVIFATGESVGKLLTRIDAHMDSLDSYVDSNARAELSADGVYVNDLYELFMHIIDTYASRITQSATSVASMYGKRLTILRYVFADITSAIFYTVFKLKTMQRKGLTKKDVTDVMNKFLRSTLIQKINSKHAEVSSVSSPSDSMAFKITSNLVLQSDIGSGAGGGAKTLTIDSSKVAHASILEVGQIYNLPKGEPTGRKRINPMVNLGPGWTVVQDPRYIDTLAKVQRIVQR